MPGHVSSYSEVSVLQKFACDAGKALSRDGAQLMQMVNDVTWIVPDSSEEGDPYKVSIVAI